MGSIEVENYCCGWCGQPTDSEGYPLREVPMGYKLEEAENLQGYCCIPQVEYTQERRTITKDMASDAGMPEIEGMLY